MDSSGRKRRGRPSSRTIKDGSEKAKKQKIEAKTQRMNEKQEAEAAAEQGAVSLPAADSSFPSMDQLREELSCAICLQICYKPSTTSCGHSFCKTCLESAIVKCGQHCPKCREQFNKGTRSCNVNTVLWNTIQLLFPEEVEARKATVDADDEATRKQENSIRHRSVHVHDPVADWNRMPDPEFTDHERQVIRRVIRATNITWRRSVEVVPTNQTYNEDPEVQPRVEALLHAQREELRFARANLEARTEGLRAARPSGVTWRNVEVTLRRARQAYDEALESQSWVDARSWAQMNVGVLFNLPRQRSTL